MTPSYPTASLTRSQGMVFHRFSGDPVTRSKRTHQWMSGVTMLVRWLCSSPASARFPLVGLRTFVLPRPQEMHPSATKGHVNQQAASFQRPPKKPVPVVLLSLDSARNAPYFEKVRVREGAVGPSFSQRTTSRVPGYGGEDLQNDKKQRQRQATNPEKNRQRDNLQITKLGDDQERRPFPKWRKTKGRELLASTKKKRSG